MRNYRPRTERSSFRAVGLVFQAPFPLRVSLLILKEITEKLRKLNDSFDSLMGLGRQKSGALVNPHALRWNFKELNAEQG